MLVSLNILIKLTSSFYNLIQVLFGFRMIVMRKIIVVSCLVGLIAGDQCYSMRKPVLCDQYEKSLDDKQKCEAADEGLVRIVERLDCLVPLRAIYMERARKWFAQSNAELLDFRKLIGRDRYCFFKDFLKDFEDGLIGSNSLNVATYLLDHFLRRSCGGGEKGWLNRLFPLKEFPKLRKAWSIFICSIKKRGGRG